MSSLQSTGRSLEIAIEVAAADWTGALPDAEKTADIALTATFGRSAPAGPPAEVSLVLADDAMVADLNRDYRDKEGPTNVLSFPMSDPMSSGGIAPADGADRPEMLGDIVIAYGVTASEAEAQGIPLAHHLSHLCVHGMLHLLGYDHESDDEAEAMERLEADILGDLGVPDPYGKER